jgi:hypothetical protein
MKGGIYAEMPRQGVDEGGGAEVMHKCCVKVRMKGGFMHKCRVRSEDEGRGIYAEMPRKR